MTQQKRPYHSYLLRMWQEGEPSDNWRASLQNVLTGEQLGFGSLEELLSFLLALRAQGERPLSQPNSRSNP